ncbi:MAG: GTPase [Myxococcales bacterium]|nr:MAG: GTPase [Myxococcales bacterium]
MNRKRVVILGAAGRDFHNFNVFFRDKPEWEVAAFTATQIPNIDGRKYPAALAGSLYPDGIPILPESELTGVIKAQAIDTVVFAYSDSTHEHVMHLASETLAAGANYLLLGTRDTMVKSTKPLISVTAVRTGSGKSQTTRYVCDILKAKGRKVVAIRHPMPYGDLVAQRVQRFGDYADLDRHQCTIEEREEYEPHIDNGEVVYAGVDYEAILREAEKEADVVFWDGGNNDFSFYKADLSIVVVDPHRAGHELTYHPGETNLRLADAIVINKMDTASAAQIETVKKNIAAHNPKATVVEADSPVTVDKPELIHGKRALVIEDGPTLTHGEMTFGAGVVAAKRFGAASLVDPRPYTVGAITETFKKYPGIGTLLPAMGYGDRQVADLQETIDRADCDVVISATPIDITRVLKVNKPIVRVRYALQERQPGQLAKLAARF